MIFAERFETRQAFIVGFAVLLAVIVNDYFSFSHAAWMVVGALIVAQLARGAPLRQSLIYCVVMLVFAILLPPYVIDATRNRLIDIGMGALIGVLFQQILFPMKIYPAFRVGVLPILRLLQNDLQREIYFFSHQLSKQIYLQQSSERMIALLQSDSLYPEWVYAVGFNPGLRAGFRFFLIQLESIVEIFFSLHALIGAVSDAIDLDVISSEIGVVLKNNEYLFGTLIDHLSECKSQKTNNSIDLTGDIVALENALEQCVPVSLELLTIAPSAMILIAIVRDLKDLREILLLLIESSMGNDAL